MTTHLWPEARARQRGPTPSTNLAAIVAAAVRVADREGLAAVSMERVARELGLSAMALYRHVPDKAALLESMVDRAVGAPPKLQGGDWRAATERLARALFAGFAKRPWTLAATGSMRLMGPHELAWLEAGLAALAPTGLSLRARQAAWLSLITQVRGLAQFALQEGRLSPRAWEAEMRPHVASRAADFPQVHALLAEKEKPAPQLDFALACLLDGIALRVAARKR